MLSCVRRIDPTQRIEPEDIVQIPKGVAHPLRAAHWACARRTEPKRPNHFHAMKIRFVSAQILPSKFIKSSLMSFSYGAVV